MATLTFLLLGLSACGDDGQNQPGIGESTVASGMEANELFRAPAILSGKLPGGMECPGPVHLQIQIHQGKGIGKIG